MLRIFLSRDERIRREAADWFARLRAPGGQDLAEEARRWADRDPAHAEALDRLGRHWDAAGLVAHRPAGHFAPPRAPVRQRFALAASIAALAMLTILFAASGLPPFAQEGRAERLSFETGVGEIRRLRFADGLIVTLDGRSKVDIETGRGRRSLRLDRGRVRIEAGSGHWPLLVVAGRRIELVDGGEADAAAGPGGAMVAAIRGRLSFKVDGGAGQRLEAGRRMAVGQGVGRLLRGPVSPLGSQWASGSFEFESAPLGEVVALANGYSVTRLVLGDPGLAAEKVTGRFRAGDIDGLAQSLAAALDLSVATGPGPQVRLDRAGSGAPSGK
jgi:transmembrane sensor